MTFTEQLTLWELCKKIALGEGFTATVYDRLAIMANEGYAVAFPLGNSIIPPEDRPNEFKVEVALSNVRQLRNPLAEFTQATLGTSNIKVGGWLDSSTGDYEIAPVVVLDDKAEAIALARKLGQRFVGDLAKYAAGEDGDIEVTT